MFSKCEEGIFVEVLEGVSRRTKVYGKNTILCEFYLEKGAVIPPHQHPQEQTGWLISGSLHFSINGDSFQANTGDSWCIPGDIEHSVQVLEDSTVIEVFSPPRKEYLP